MMAHDALSAEYEETLKEDCDKLLVVLKNCEKPDAKKEEENLKILYRINFLISYRQGSKMLNITYFTIKYLCLSPVLPLVLLEIVRDTLNLKVCTYVLEILTKLILKNAITPETERKTVRKFFWEPAHFKIAVDAFKKFYSHFMEEKTNPLVYETQIRLLKIINCLYSRKGQTQISLLNVETVEFVGCHLSKYKAHKEISQSVLPLIKTVCRNKKNCALICSEIFLQALVTVVPATGKYQTAVTILKLLSRNPEAVQEMSRSEKTFHFVLSVVVNHAEKSNSKKHLMTTLYRISKPFAGNQIISKTYLWLLLLDFFMKIERFEELRQRLIAVKAYTILCRGVTKNYISITPTKLNLNFSPEIANCKTNNDTDDSDNEESEDDEENKQESAKAASEDNDESDESETESEDERYVCEEKPDKKIIAENIDYMKPYYKELLVDAPVSRLKIYQAISLYKKHLNRVVCDRVKRHESINKQAFPDAVHAESDKNDNFFIVPNINYFSPEDMARKIKVLKSLHKDHYKRKVVYDLDELIESGRDIDIPDPEVYKMMKSDVLLRKSSCAGGKKSPVATLEFESRFEGGNLRKVEQVAACEYNLFLCPDVNMTNGLQWFYFQMFGMVARENYKLNIVNFQKVNSQFNYGLQPVLFSVTDFLINATGWRKVGEGIMYYGNEFVNEDSEKQFRTLSFTLNFPHSNDYCYLAYHFPYTYTRLMNTVLPFLSMSENVYSRVDKLTSTVNGFNEVPLITVTGGFNGDKSTIPLERRPLVFLTARVHPGESNSSWIMDGVLQFLLNQQDERAAKAREHYIFKIIPMLNPEGVIYGNSRCGLTGNDLNRCWKKPHPVLHPEIYYAKKLVQFAKEQIAQPIFAFVDIHGHSRKKFFFLYGCNPKQSWNDSDVSLADSSDPHHMLPKALGANENMKMSYCRYTIERKREATCRVVMWREFGIKCSYTLECSFCSGENKKKMTTQMLRDIGVSIIASLANLAETA